MKIKELRHSKRIIKVGFLVIFDSVFPAESILNQMLKNKHFDPKIYVIPDTLRGEEHMLNQLNKTFNNLKEKYNDRVFFCKTNSTFIDISKEVDIVCSANPYDAMTHRLYRSIYFAEQGILSFYISYGYHLTRHNETVYALDFFTNQWKFYIESHDALKVYRIFNPSKGKNSVLVGYPKMDKLYNKKPNTDNKITIIIAPHHTVLPVGILQTSTFLQYANFFLSLPKKYPNVNWIFRPHPLLFTTLRRNELWGSDKVDSYINKICENTNVLYEAGGNYFDSFNQADGIILDSLSFIAEWLYTEKKGCFLMKNTDVMHQFYPCGRKMLSFYVSAYSEDDIINYITDVINGTSHLTNAEITYIKKKIKINYPKSSEIVVNDIEKHLR